MLFILIHCGFLFLLIRILSLLLLIMDYVLIYLYNIIKSISNIYLIRGFLIHEVGNTMLNRVIRTILNWFWFINFLCNYFLSFYLGGQLLLLAYFNYLFRLFYYVFLASFWINFWCKHFGFPNFLSFSALEGVVQINVLDLIVNKQIVISVEIVLKLLVIVFVLLLKEFINFLGTKRYRTLVEYQLVFRLVIDAQEYILFTKHG